LTLSPYFCIYLTLGVGEMSDGPHKSLPMRRRWKRLAEYADNQNFERDQVREAVLPALERDCRGEVSEDFLVALCDACDDRQNSLFRNDTHALEALRSSAGTGLGRVVLDYALQAATRGDAGAEIAEKAMTAALKDRAARGARQVEEHYYRKSTQGRASRVRERIEQGIRAADIGGLARRLLKSESGRATTEPAKRQGLDDGVKL
jgi:GNAT superfamily N-acetyltransferase